VPSRHPRSSAMLRSVIWYSVTDDSGQPIKPETIRNILHERIAQLHRVVSLESLYRVFTWNKTKQTTMM
jgi:hypothetical protein